MGSFIYSYQGTPSNPDERITSETGYFTTLIPLMVSSSSAIPNWEGVATMATVTRVARLNFMVEVISFVIIYDLRMKDAVK